jgi:hypothetical protein
MILLPALWVNMSMDMAEPLSNKYMAWAISMNAALISPDENPLSTCSQERMLKVITSVSVSDPLRWM